MDSQPKPVREGDSRVQQSSEAQSNGGGWGGGRMQEMGGERMIQKTVDNGGEGNRLGCNNSNRE